MIVYGIIMGVEWFPAVLGGRHQETCNINWKLTNMVFEICDEESDAYEHVSDFDRQQAKPLTYIWLYMSGDGLTKAPGFSYDVFGVDGEKLLDYASAYNYAEHSAFIAATVSNDICLCGGGAPWMLAMAYGRISDAVGLLAGLLVETTNFVKNPLVRGFKFTSVFTSYIVSGVHYMLGQQQNVRSLWETLGVNFESAERWFVNLTHDDGFFTSMEQRGPGGGTISLSRCVWQLKAMCILNDDTIPIVDAKAWLETLPTEHREFVLVSATASYLEDDPCDAHALYGGHQTFWLALAFEKVGLYQEALRYADWQLELKTTHAAVPESKWIHVTALACKGRVFAKLDRHQEALAAFQAAASVSLESYRMMQAFAYRELAQYEQAPAKVRADANASLAATLAGFGTFCTRAEFDSLKFGTP